MITDPHTKSTININGEKVPLWVYGDIKKPLIFFIHGYFRGFSDYVGDLPMRHLMKNYCVIAFDLPGFGKSKNLEMDRIEFLNRIIDTFANGRKYYLFGLSYGGLQVLKYADRYPEKINGLIIAGTPYFYGIRSLIKISYFVPYVKNKELVKILKEFSFISKQNLGKITRPTLLLYSTKDKKATASMGNKLKKLLPNSQINTIDKYDHSWLMHDIGESGFLKSIKDFIEKTIQS